MSMIHKSIIFVLLLALVAPAWAQDTNDLLTDLAQIRSCNATDPASTLDWVFITDHTDEVTTFKSIQDVYNERMAEVRDD